MVVHLWHDVPVGKKTLRDVNVIIEIPMGSTCKYELDKKLGIIKVDRIIASAVYYPGNYGFIPQTYALDNDPIDVLVVSQVSFAPGVLVAARPIGGVHMIDAGEKDDKIICVPIGDPKFSSVTDLKELPSNTRDEIEEFFRVYKNLEGKSVKITGRFGRTKALSLIARSRDRYKKKFLE